MRYPCIILSVSAAIAFIINPLPIFIVNYGIIILAAAIVVNFISFVSWLTIRVHDILNRRTIHFGESHKEKI